MVIEKITNELIGKKISCVIDNVIINDAEIYKRGNTYYILNNLKDGRNLPKSDKKDYKCDWHINRGDKSDLIYNSIKNIKLLDFKTIHELW